MTTLATLPFTVGAPDLAGPLAVFPLFGPPPRLEYLSFAEAAARQNAAVTELPAGASVNDLLVVNPGPLPVLLYEGEELVGAQQDRTVDIAVLVPAGAKLPIAVSCVEQNRWDHSRHAEPFTPSPRAAFPTLRAAKSRAMRASLAAGAEARADQGEVWATVGPSAMGDLFDAGEGPIAAIERSIQRRDGQLGCVVAIDGRFRVLDAVSRADVFAALFGPLVRGYALDARGQSEAAPPSVADAEAFLASLAEGPAGRSGSHGLGQTIHFTRTSAGGTGLEVDGELIQLSAHAG